MTVTTGLEGEVRRYAVYKNHAKIRDAEGLYNLLQRSGKVACQSTSACGQGALSLAEDIAATRKRVQQSLMNSYPATGAISSDDTENATSELTSRVDVLEKENREMKKEIQDLRGLISKLQAAFQDLSADSEEVAPPPQVEKEAEAEEDEDIDLFGSDDDEEEDEAKEKLKEERVKAYEAKKGKKPGAIAKSSVILDVKPWDDETDMKEVENMVRAIEMDGLLWGAAKLVPLAYGIKKLQIMCVVEDEKVSVEELSEKIEECEDLVQSVDIAAFNKI